MSALTCPGLGVFPAFSGNGAARNQPGSVKLKDEGPLPPGRYYIVNRPSGGRLGAVREEVTDLFAGTDRSSWFALFRDDGVLNDLTWVDKVRRGQFRTHPVGPRGLSLGCITLAHFDQFNRLRARIKTGPVMAIPNGRGTAYGTVTVR